MTSLALAQAQQKDTSGAASNVQPLSQYHMLSTTCPLPPSEPSKSCPASSCSYLDAANNPSESIVAKRRGYGTIVSDNVPPTGAPASDKELASLRSS